MTARCCAGPDDPYCAIRGPKAGPRPNLRDERTLPMRIYAQTCIIFHDLARALAPPQLLRDLFM